MTSVRPRSALALSLGGVALVAFVAMILWAGRGPAPVSVGVAIGTQAAVTSASAVLVPSPIPSSRLVVSTAPVPAPARTPTSSQPATSQPPPAPAVLGLTASLTPTARPPAKAAAAPTSALGFRPRDTVVALAFPLPASSGYRYSDLWRVPRLGLVSPYNQIRGVTSGGTLLRAHDGVDLRVRNGTNVLAPFAGLVVNPAAIWKPWDPQRYGTVVVIRSTEAGSRGYLVLLAHLSRRSVVPGDTVSRGQVVGRTGQTGNATGTPPHLHIELRAPFKIAFAYAGVRRSLDVFDPLPSLHEADPNR